MGSLLGPLHGRTPSAHIVDAVRGILQRYDDPEVAFYVLEALTSSRMSVGRQRISHGSYTSCNWEPSGDRKVIVTGRQMLQRDLVASKAAGLREYIESCLESGKWYNDCALTSFQGASGPLEVPDALFDWLAHTVNVWLIREGMISLGLPSTIPSGISHWLTLPSTKGVRRRLKQVSNEELAILELVDHYGAFRVLVSGFANIVEWVSATSPDLSRVTPGQALFRSKRWQKAAKREGSRNPSWEYEPEELWYVPEAGTTVWYWPPTGDPPVGVTVVEADEVWVHATLHDGSTQRLGYEHLTEVEPRQVYVGLPDMLSNPANVVDRAPSEAAVRQRLIRDLGKRRADGLEVVFVHVAPHKYTRSGDRNVRYAAAVYRDDTGLYGLFEWHGAGVKAPAGEDIAEIVHVESFDDTVAHDARVSTERSLTEARVQERRATLERSGRPSLFTRRDQ